MDRDIIMVRNFNAVRNIDSVIERWAAKSGFKESTKTCSHINLNDLTYCFYFDTDLSTVFLTINILDNRVRLETWAIERVDEKPKQAISELLMRLRQAPYQT